MIHTFSKCYIRLPTARLPNYTNRQRTISIVSDKTRHISRAIDSADISVRTHHPVMGKSKKSGIGRGGGEKKHTSKPTHFLCFPLATSSTVPIFAKSIKYFQEVSLEPRQSHLPQGKSCDGSVEMGQDAARGPSRTTDDSDPLGNITRAREAQPSFEDSLKVLPSIVYRGPGTLHLTLGVMDLSEPVEMQKAIELLESLDLQTMLRDAANGPPVAMKAARKWDSRADNSTEGTGADQTDTALATISSLNKAVSPPPTPRPVDSSQSSELTLPKISLTGISAFASAKRARVIWAQPRAQASTDMEEMSSSVEGLPGARPTFNEEAQSRLYNFGLHVHYAFKTAGLIKETRPIVLHATIANMRYKTQAKGGRTTKGRAWVHGKKRWEDGLVDIRNLVKVFNEFDGQVDSAKAALSDEAESESEEAEDAGENDEGENPSHEDQERVDDRDKHSSDPDKEFIWCSSILLDRVAICKMGATKMEDPLWVEGYPPVSEKMIMKGESSNS